MEGQVTISLEDYEQLKEDAKGVKAFRVKYDVLISKTLKKLSVILHSNFDDFTCLNHFKNKTAINTFDLYNITSLEHNFWAELSIQEENNNEDY